MGALEGLAVLERERLEVLTTPNSSVRTIKLRSLDHDRDILWSQRRREMTRSHDPRPHERNSLSEHYQTQRSPEHHEKISAGLRRYHAQRREKAVS